MEINVPEKAEEQSKAPQRDAVESVLLAALAFPPLVGLAIIALILAGVASDQVLASGPAMSTALLVGGLLILVPPALYAVSPDRHAAYHGALEERLNGGGGGSPSAPPPDALGPAAAGPSTRGTQS
jgi:hypothetical protein